MNENWDDIWKNLSQELGSNPARKMRQDAILKKLQKGSILDFGAGDGDLVLRMRSLGLNAIGVEMSNEGIYLANQKAKGLGYREILYSLNYLVGNFKKYKNIVMSEVLEHIDNPTPILKSISKNLHKDGIIIITVPSGPISEFDRFLGHYRHYTKKSLRLEIEKSGFEVLEINQIGFPTINIIRVWCLINGKRTINKLVKHKNAANSRIGKMIFRIFGSMDKIDSRLGWQLVATAKFKTR